MLIACVQSDVTFAQPLDNLTRAVAWMEQAAKIDGGGSAVHSATQSSPRGAELVVFPECMLSGYTFDSRQQAMEVAIEVDDPIFRSLKSKARDLGQFLTIGFLERSGDKLFNSAVLLGPGGIIGCYRKIHLPGLGVDRFVDRGDRPYQAFNAPTARQGEARIGLAICYDGSFPEPMRVLALAGADVITLSTNWPDEGMHASTIIPPARSMENHLYFVAANRVGTENGVTFCGRSSICGPDGARLASSDDDQESLLVAAADLKLARHKTIHRSAGTHVIDRFADRRPEFYGSITEPVKREANASDGNMLMP